MNRTTFRSRSSVAGGITAAVGIGVAAVAMLVPPPHRLSAAEEVEDVEAVADAPAAAAASATPLPADWPAFHGGGALRGEAAPVGPPPMRERWAYVTDEEDPAPIIGGAAIVGDTAYVADADGFVHAVNLQTGERRWRYDAGGTGFETTPLVLDGKVILGDLSGVLHALSAETGDKLWAFETDTPIHASANVSPDGGRVVFGNDGAEIICVTADGDEVWRKAAGDRVNSTPAIGFGAAFVSGCDAKLRAISLDGGGEQFGADLGGECAVSSALLDDRIVTATARGTVVCYSGDGSTKLWQRDVDGSQGFFSSPAIAQGVVVVGSRDRKVYAFNVDDGEPLWVFSTKGDVDSSPAISDGRVYFGSKDKKFYVLDLKGGEKLWEFTAGRGIAASPAIGAGVVVVGDMAGTLFCFEPEAAD